MSPLHLIWIIPLSASLGGVVVALFAGSREKRDDCYYCPFPCERNK